MAAVLQHAGLVLLYLFLFLLDLLVILGFPGAWVMFAVIFIFALIQGVHAIGWAWIISMAAILVLAEIAESFLGIVVVAGKGATRWGVLGAFAGGLAGAVAGTAAIPVAGSLIFGLLGAFTGAVVCEYIYYNSLDRAMRTGFFAFLGKLAATFVKFSLGLAVLVIFIIRTWSR